MKQTWHLYAFCQSKLRKLHSTPQIKSIILRVCFWSMCCLHLCFLITRSPSSLLLLSEKKEKILIIWSERLNFSRAIHAITFQKKPRITNLARFIHNAYKFKNSNSSLANSCAKYSSSAFFCVNSIVWRKEKLIIWYIREC